MSGPSSVSLNAPSPSAESLDPSKRLMNLVANEDASFESLSAIANDVIFIEGSTVTIQFKSTVSIAAPEFMSAVVNHLFIKAEIQNIDEIKLVNCKFQDTAWKTYVESLNMFSAVKKLIFEGCSLSEDQLPHLFRFLQSNPDITIYNLEISQQEFNADGIKMLCEGLKELPLRNLCLNEDGITDDQYAQIVHALKKNSSLQTLQFLHNRITDAGILHTQLLPSSIMIIDLGGNPGKLETTGGVRTPETATDSEKSKKRKREGKDDELMAVQGLRVLSDPVPDLFSIFEEGLTALFSSQKAQKTSCPLEKADMSGLFSSIEPKKKDWEEKVDLIRAEIKVATLPTQEHLNSIIGLRVYEDKIYYDEKLEFLKKKQLLFEKLLKKIYLIENIQGDGNCFFASIWEGLKRAACFDGTWVILNYMKMNRKDFKTEISNFKNVTSDKDKSALLRAIIVHYIKNHPNEFQHFIADLDGGPIEFKMDLDGDVEMKAGEENPVESKCETKDESSDQSNSQLVKNLDNYCNRMKQDGVWGGDLEIQALQSIFSELETPLTIQIFDLSMPPSVIAGKFVPPNLLNRAQEGAGERVINLLRENQNHYQLLADKPAFSQKLKKRKIELNAPVERSANILESASTVSAFNANNILAEEFAFGSFNEFLN